MAHRRSISAPLIIIGLVFSASTAKAQARTATSSVASSTIAAADTTAPEPTMANVRFESAQAGVALHVTEGDKVTLLCTAPCETSLPAGEVSLSLSAGGDPVAAEAALQVSDGQRLVGAYRSRKGLRWGLGIAGGGAMIGGGVMMMSGIDGNGSEVTVGGIAIAVVGAVLLGLTEAFPDQATVDVAAQ